MKIMILGHGLVGSVLSRLLHEDRSVKSVIVADICFKQEKKFEKFHQEKINLESKAQLSNLLKKHMPDLVINSASPKFNSEILSKCAAFGINYMDMAACWDPDPDKKASCPYKIEQLDFDKKFREKRILGLMEAGVSPGMTNLFVRECADEFDKLEEVKIRLIDHSGTGEFHTAWSKESLLDEIGSKPLIYKNGKFMIVEPFSGEEAYNFPAPFDEKKVRMICQDEIGTIPFYIKLKSIDIKDYDDQADIHKFFYDLGLTSKKKIKMNGVALSPFEFVNKVLPDAAFNGNDPRFKDAVFAFAIEASGKINGRKRIIRYFVSFPRQKEINKLGLDANFISYPTAISAKIFAMAIPKINEIGIIPPEALGKQIRKYMLKELARIKYIVIKKEWLR